MAFQLLGQIPLFYRKRVQGVGHIHGQVGQLLIIGWLPAMPGRMDMFVEGRGQLGPSFVGPDLGIQRADGPGVPFQGLLAAQKTGDEVVDDELNERCAAGPRRIKNQASAAEKRPSVPAPGLQALGRPIQAGGPGAWLSDG